MKNFGNCIWLTTRKNKYYYCTNGFQLHMSIKTNLNVDIAYKKLLSLKNKKYILILGAWVYEISDGFYCLYRIVIKIVPEIKSVRTPHVSFYYSYIPISEEVRKQIISRIDIDEISFDRFEIKNCNDHFSSW